MDDIREATYSDTDLQMVISFIRMSWPQRMAQLVSLQDFYMARAQLSKSDDLVLYQDRVVIPATQRAQILQQIHKGHLGLTKCKERARMSVWWPAISADLVHIFTIFAFFVEHRPTTKKKRESHSKHLPYLTVHGKRSQLACVNLRAGNASS